MTLVSILRAAWPDSAFAQETSADLRRRAESLAYDLDHDQALALLRRSIALAPDDPAAHRSLASVLWLNMLFRRGAVTVDHYLGSFSRSNVDLKQPPPEIDAEFHSSVTRAIELAEQRVDAHPADRPGPLTTSERRSASRRRTSQRSKGGCSPGFARHAGLRRARKGARLDPSRKDAGLIVGTYRYIVSTLSLPMRMMAYVAGFGGGRERGISACSRTRRPPVRSTTATDAMFALVLVYNRERRYDDALGCFRNCAGCIPVTGW